MPEQALLLGLTAILFSRDSQTEYLQTILRGPDANAFAGDVRGINQYIFIIHEAVTSFGEGYLLKSLTMYGTILCVTLHPGIHVGGICAATQIQEADHLWVVCFLFFQFFFEIRNKSGKHILDIKGNEIKILGCNILRNSNSCS